MAPLRPVGRVPATRKSVPRVTSPRGTGRHSRIFRVIGTREPVIQLYGYRITVNTVLLFRAMNMFSVCTAAVCTAGNRALLRLEGAGRALVPAPCHAPGGKCRGCRHTPNRAAEKTGTTHPGPKTAGDRSPGACWREGPCRVPVPAGAPPADPYGPLTARLLRARRCDTHTGTMRAGGSATRGTEG